MNYTPENTNVAVIGGGNIGTQFACVCASKGYKVNVFSSKPEQYDGTLEVVDEFEHVTVGKLNKVTADIGEAVAGCQIIIITHPAFHLRSVADQLLPYIKEDMNICVLPGTGGAEFAFRECMKAGATLFGLQRVPTVARLEQYGKRVRCEGLRSELFLASIPSDKAAGLAEFMSGLWGIPCTPLPNYLSVTLTPSNPILHTTRLRTLFADYEEGKVYERNPLFYGEWSDASSELLIACDGELQEMLKLMDKLDLHNVRSLKLHYESDTVEAMTRKLCSIKSLHNLASPMKQVDGGWVPDFKSRYFTADFSYGLSVIVQIAHFAGTDVPELERVLNWYNGIRIETDEFRYEDYGIRNTEDFLKFYSL